MQAPRKRRPPGKSDVSSDSLTSIRRAFETEQRRGKEEESFDHLSLSPYPRSIVESCTYLVSQIERLFDQLQISDPEVLLLDQFLYETEPSIEKEENLISLYDDLKSHKKRTLDVAKAITSREFLISQLHKYVDDISATEKRRNHMKILDLRRAVVQCIQKLQDASLSVVEQIQMWRDSMYMTRPWPFLWNDINYLNKMKTDLIVFDSSNLYIIIPIKLTDNPFMLDLQSLIVSLQLGFDADLDNLQKSSHKKASDPSVIEFKKKLRWAKRVLDEEDNLQALVQQELLENLQNHCILFSLRTEILGTNWKRFPTHPGSPLSSIDGNFSSSSSGEDLDCIPSSLDESSIQKNTSDMLLQSSMSNQLNAFTPTKSEGEDGDSVSLPMSPIENRLRMDGVGDPALTPERIDFLSSGDEEFRQLLQKRMSNSDIKQP